MTLRFDVFWSFRSPYSYLAGPRLLDLVETHDVECVLRPVHPIALRIENYFKTQKPEARAYFFRDHPRVAEYLGMPLKWPKPDPVVMSFETGEVPVEQPYIHRLTRLAVAAARRGRGIQFARSLSHLIFGGTEDWDQGNHMARAAAAAGLDLAELDAEILADPDDFDAEIARNHAAHKDAGHWGVPLMVFEGEPFFGQDRIDLLIWRMKQKGLRRHS